MKNRPRWLRPTRAAKAQEAPKKARIWFRLFMASTSDRSRASMPEVTNDCIAATSPPAAHSMPANAATAMRVNTRHARNTTWAAGCMVWKARWMKLMGKD